MMAVFSKLTYLILTESIRGNLNLFKIGGPEHLESLLTLTLKYDVLWLVAVLRICKKVAYNNEFVFSSLFDRLHFVSWLK